MKNYRKNTIAIFKLLLMPTVTIIFICSWTTGFAKVQQSKTDSIQKKLKQIENSIDGRIGVFAMNTANNTYIQYRANEHFPFCSTYKLIGVAAILKKSMTRSDFLSQKIFYDKSKISAGSPITSKYINNGMTISALCAAAIKYSDNTAINLLMKNLGGPAVVNRFASSIGDHLFRLDRWEPELNSAIPGDLRDTTTPAAMAYSLRQLVLGDTLASSQRQLLQTWLKETVTGNFKIRAGVPQGWIVGDKTGSGDYGTTNDIAVIWPPKCSPIVMVIYLTQKQKNATKHDNIVALITKLIIQQLSLTDQCIRI